MLGQAFDKALGNKKGILRAGYFLMPMDETLGMAAVDFCGRTAIRVNTKVNVRLVGDLQSELVHDFFEGFARGARANVHTRALRKVQPSQDRISIQGLCPGSARRVLEG